MAKRALGGTYYLGAIGGEHGETIISIYYCSLG